MRRISFLLTILITSLVMTLAGLVAGPIATASETETVRISAAFPFGSPLLTDTQKTVIKQAVTTSGTDITFVVTGAAGKIPGVSDEAVRTLATKRAQAVESYLVKLGVNKSSVTIKVKMTRLGIVPKTKIVGSDAVTAITTAPIDTTPIPATPTATPNTPITTSGAPTNPVGTIANGQSIVSWTAPASNGGAAIISYTVTSSPGSFTCTDASTSCTVTGLTNGTAYTFTVTATNSAGTGSASNASSSVTPITTAGAPTSVSATAGDTQGVVSWTAPASDGGAAIISYTVTSSPGSFTCTDASTSCTVTGLTNGTAYTFTVTATNSAGTGSASNASSSVTPITTAGAPTSVSATAGDTQGVVSWTAPASDGGAAIISYTVTSTPGGFLCSHASTSCTVTGLTNGTSYTFTVTATNSAGTGSASTSSSAITPTAPVLTCATGATCIVGNTGPGGGVVYYVNDAGFNCGSGYTSTGSPSLGLCHYLEVAPSGWNNSGTPTVDPRKFWASSTNEVLDVVGIAETDSFNNSVIDIGRGLKNSLAIVAQNNDISDPANIAAGAARAYAGNSKNDWYLPTTTELNLICQWNHGVPQIVTTTCAGGTINGGSFGAGSSGFAADYYWSSSERNVDNAWFQTFADGSQYEGDKGNKNLPFTYFLYVRPIRAF